MGLFVRIAANRAISLVGQGKGMQIKAKMEQSNVLLNTPLFSLLCLGSWVNIS